MQCSGAKYKCMDRDYFKYSNEQVVNIPTSYVGGPDFGYRPGKPLPSVRGFAVWAGP
jgi:hypothetical protein